jgi:hypothetical protein
MYVDLGGASVSNSTFGEGEPGQRDAIDLSRRLSRVLAAVHRVGNQIGEREEVDEPARMALTAAIATLEALTAEAEQQMGVAPGQGPAGARSASGIGSNLWRVEGLARGEGFLVAGVVFPTLSDEGSRWVDAGTLHALFHDAFSGISGRDDAERPTSVSLSMVSPAARERELRLIATADPEGMPDPPCHAMLWDAGQLLAVACGRVART